MRCPHHPDQPSISCADCIMQDDYEDELQEIVLDAEFDRMKARLVDAEQAIEALREAIEEYEEARAGTLED